MNLAERHLWSLSGKLASAIAGIEVVPGNTLPLEVAPAVDAAMSALLCAQQVVVKAALASGGCDNYRPACDDKTCGLSPAKDDHDAV